MPTQYLYGASVQGIQEFIFQTNELREIAGASELVEQICTKQFEEAIGAENLKEDKSAIVTAAGNIRYLFKDKSDCEKLVRKFPKRVMEFAPGITLSQAVIEINEGNVTSKDFEELEKKLKIQRNKPFRSNNFGQMALLRSRKTGLPAIDSKTVDRKEEYYDRGTKAKKNNSIYRICNDFFSTSYDENKLPWKLEDITNSKGENYSWLAVIHADGNNMGAKILEMSNELTPTVYASKFREFSQAIDKSTKEAASESYSEIAKKYKLDKLAIYPFRPVVIGGDDLTIICRADLAIEFTELFLKKFKQKTESNLKPLGIKTLENGLTACAGIAFLKKAYPFHYGYHLAEELCGHAKKIGKQKNGTITPSCLMFHKVLDSFVERFEDIQERVLTAGEIHLDFGPYFTDSKPTIENLLKSVEILTDGKGNAIKSGLRQWLTDLHNNRGIATQKMERLLEIGDKDKLKSLGLKENKGIEGDKSPVFDWLTIHTINQGGN